MNNSAATERELSPTEIIDFYESTTIPGFTITTVYGHRDPNLPDYIGHVYGWLNVRVQHEGRTVQRFVVPRGGRGVHTRMLWGLLRTIVMDGLESSFRSAQPNLYRDYIKRV